MITCEDSLQPAGTHQLAMQFNRLDEMRIDYIPCSSIRLNVNQLGDRPVHSVDHVCIDDACRFNVVFETIRGELSRLGHTAT